MPAAAELHRDTSAQGQEAYLHLLAMMASRLKLATIPATKLGRFEKHDPALFFGPSHLGKPFFIIEWRMEPGAVLPPHKHGHAEHCYVVEGEVYDHEHAIRAGDYELRLPGSSHAAVRTRTGAVLLIVVGGSDERH